jgi:hypothetical protein
VTLKSIKTACKEAREKGHAVLEFAEKGATNAKP